MVLNTSEPGNGCVSATGPSGAMKFFWSFSEVAKNTTSQAVTFLKKINDIRSSTFNDYRNAQVITKINMEWYCNYCQNVEHAI